LVADVIQRHTQEAIVSTNKKHSTLRDDSATTRPAASAISVADARWFRAVADYTYDWESWHGPDGRLIWVNPAVERVTGYTVSECLGMNDYPLPIVAPEDRERIATVLADAQMRASGDDVDFQAVHRRGETRWMSLCWQPMYDGSTTYLGFRTSVRDVTERRMLRDQLRLHAEHLEQLVQERTARLWQLEQRQQKMEKLASLGQLAAGIAHEINNPLAGIRNAFALIKSGLSQDHEHFELLELIDREIERISGITHQMYQLYRRNPQQPADFAMERTVGEVIYVLENAARKHQVRLQCVSPPAPIHVWLVEGEVKQILYNLMRNAIQASPSGDEVTVSIAFDDHEVIVQIKDNGPGIPSDILPRIFEPFFSTRQTDTEEGMGLGLSVSMSLIEAMGGRIEVASRPETGSIFTAVFPRRLESTTEPENG
jgi:PAS domain S-box-containing protein